MTQSIKSAGSSNSYALGRIGRELNHLKTLLLHLVVVLSKGRTRYLKCFGNVDELMSNNETMKEQLTQVRVRGAKKEERKICVRND